MLLVNKWLATLICKSPLLHGILDFLVLPDPLCCIIKNGALNDVAAELEILLAGAISDLTNHVLVFGNEL